MVGGGGRCSHDRMGFEIESFFMEHFPGSELVIGGGGGEGREVEAIQQRFGNGVSCVCVRVCVCVCVCVYADLQML